MTICRSSLLIATLSLLPALQPPSTNGQEWPRFRGIDGNGIGEITSLPSEITKADYEWAIKLQGVGHSSPVLWGKHLFLTIYHSASAERRIECYDCTSGTQQWSWSSPLAKHNLHKHNNFASSTPAASADAVFAVWGSGEKTEAVALSHQGEVIWKREWPSFSSDHGFGASPILVDNVLVLQTDAVSHKRSQIIGLDATNGETIWEVERITEGENEKHITAYNTPTVIEVNGEPTVAVFQTNDGWKGLAPATGEVIWEHQGAYKQRSVGSITAGNGLLFAAVGSGGAGKMATALQPHKSKPPKVLYELGIADGLSYVPTPLIHKGLLYLWGDGGVLTCRNARSGKEIYRERVGGNFFSSPVIADGKIYCGSRNGELIAVKLGKKFEVLGRSHLDSGMNATPAIAQNRIFLRTNTHLISIPGK